MGGIFSKPKAPKPDPSLQRSLDMQEQRLKTQEAEQRQQISARKRARRSGGLRLLMSQGVPDESSNQKLGGGS